MSQEEQAKEMGKFLEIRNKFSELKNLMTARILHQNKGHEHTALESVYWTNDQLNKLENDFNILYFPDIRVESKGKI